MSGKKKVTKKTILIRVLCIVMCMALMGSVLITLFDIM